MDYIEVATRIAGAEDPYSEFEKEASSLNEIEKTSLARAFNKQMFLSKLDNRDGDGHLDFDVITPEVIGTHVSKSDTDSNMSKTASVKEAVDKSLLVTDDMFVLESRADNSYSTPYDTSDLQKQTIDVANRIAEDKMIKVAADSRLSVLEKRAEIEASMPALMSDLVKIARDPSETRTLIMHVINSKQEDLIPSIVDMSQSRESDISTAKLCDLGIEKVAKINGILDEIKDKKKMYEMAVEPETEDEKVAGTGTAALYAGLKLTRGLLGTGKFIGKKVVNTVKSPVKLALATTGIGTSMATDAHKEKILRQIM